MQQKNKLPEKKNHKKISPLRRARNLTTRLAWIILMWFPAYEYDVLEFRSHLVKSINDDTYEVEKNISNAIVIYCKWETWERISINSELWWRVQKERLFVIDRLYELWIDKNPPEFWPHNSVRCDLEPSYTSWCNINGAVVSGTNMMLSSNNIKNLTIRHEIAHFVDNPNAPSWMREFAADYLVGINTRTGSYSVSHLWAKFLELDLEFSILYDENEDKDQISVYIRSILNKKLGGNIENMDQVLDILMSSSPSELLQETINFLTSLESDIWIGALEVQADQLQRIVDRNTCLQDTWNTNTPEIFKRFWNYIGTLGYYLILKIQKILLN